MNISRNIFVLCSLILFAFSFGYLLMLSFDGHQLKQFMPQWKGAQPVTTEMPSATGYFRKRFKISSYPRKAYLVVAGTDKLTLYVNGSSVGTSRFFGARTTEIFDLKQYLKPGDNLIALEVNNHTMTSPPELTARLELLFPDGSHRTILTDSTWRANNLSEYQKDRHASWNSMEFHELDWPFATINVTDDRRPTYPLRIPEKVYQLLPDGEWIWGSSNTDANVTFIRDFEIDSSVITGAWLGVSSVGRYSISLNGLLLYSHSGTLKTMELFDLNPYVHLGRNRLQIHVESDVLQPKLGVSGFVTTDNGAISLSSDGRWGRVTNTGGSKIGPVHKTGSMQSSSSQRLTLSFKKIETPMAAIFQRITRLLIFSLIVLVVTVMLIFVLLYLEKYKTGHTSLWDGFEIFITPFLWGSIITGTLLVVNYDSRIEIEIQSNHTVAILIAVAVLIWGGIIFVERNFLQGYK